MNENVCKKCRRYGYQPLPFRIVGWLCAQYGYEVASKVLPGFRVFEGSGFIQVGESMSPPDWCERPLEHIVTKPGEEVDITADQKIAGYDGNKAAERHTRQKTVKGCFLL